MQTDGTTVTNGWKTHEMKRTTFESYRGRADGAIGDKNPLGYRKGRVL